MALIRWFLRLFSAREALKSHKLRESTFQTWRSLPTVNKHWPNQRCQGVFSSLAKFTFCHFANLPFVLISNLALLAYCQQTLTKPTLSRFVFFFGQIYLLSFCQFAIRAIFKLGQFLPFIFCQFGTFANFVFQGPLWCLLPILPHSEYLVSYSSFSVFDTKMINLKDVMIQSSSSPWPW